MKKIVAILGVFALLSFMSYKFLFKKDDQKYLDQGIEYFNENRFKEAIVYFDMSEKLGNTDALKYSGVIYLESDNPQKAIPKLKSYLDHLDSEHEDRRIILNDLGAAPHIKSWGQAIALYHCRKYW